MNLNTIDVRDFCDLMEQYITEISIKYQITKPVCQRIKIETSDKVGLISRGIYNNIHNDVLWKL